LRRHLFSLERKDRAARDRWHEEIPCKHTAPTVLSWFQLGRANSTRWPFELHNLLISNHFPPDAMLTDKRAAWRHKGKGLESNGAAWPVQAQDPVGQRIHVSARELTFRVKPTVEAGSREFLRRRFNGRKKHGREKERDKTHH
jgi:hypothetical protein